MNRLMMLITYIFFMTNLFSTFSDCESRDPPEVNSVFPRIGSTNGGQQVSVYGRGNYIFWWLHRSVATFNDIFLYNLVLSHILPLGFARNPITYEPDLGNFVELVGRRYKQAYSCTTHLEGTHPGQIVFYTPR